MAFPGSCVCRWFVNLVLDFTLGKSDLEAYVSRTEPNPKPNV